MLRRGGDVRKGEVIHYAIDRKADNIMVLDLLIENGADINLPMYKDHYLSQSLYYFMGLGTPLHRAAMLGKVDIVRYLLEKGANLHVKDLNGRTALDCAIMMQHEEVIQVLQ